MWGVRWLRPYSTVRQCLHGAEVHVLPGTLGSCQPQSLAMGGLWFSALEFGHPPTPTQHHKYTSGPA